MKILVIIENLFNDIELTSTLSCLKRADSSIEIDYYNPDLKEAVGQYGIAHVDNIKNEIDLQEYSALFIPGGRGAQSLRTNKISLELIQTANKLHKYIFAICDAPNVLREAGIIDENTPYAAFPSEWAETYRTKYYLNNYVIHSTKNIFTGRCADASMKFGYKIVSVLLGKDKVRPVVCGMTGNCK
ncbi:DJ-1/PfpI family protein [Mycoplasma hafezii]|uniref:DJ-1/PfpI family protein n=1 Tax=Mycoplasma hafezii TaxID=525886 RepID=UPI003CED23B3